MIGARPLVRSADSAMHACILVLVGKLHPEFLYYYFIIGFYQASLLISYITRAPSYNSHAIENKKFRMH